MGAVSALLPVSPSPGFHPPPGPSGEREEQEGVRAQHPGAAGNHCGNQPGPGRVAPPGP